LPLTISLAERRAGDAAGAGMDAAGAFPGVVDRTRDVE
jgi:hypothetical protein